MERRRNTHAAQAPIEQLRELPALVLLDRLPVAALAVGQDRAIVFANLACADMLGYDQDELTSMTIDSLFRALPDDISALDAVRAFAGVIVDLKHRDGSLVRARMSQSVLLRDDDQVALTTFQDLTEQLWAREL